MAAGTRQECQVTPVAETGTAKDAEHYQQGDYNYQPIEIIQANFTREEFTGYLKGNMLDYLLRRKDDPVKDARKAHQFSKWLVEHLEGKKINPRE